MCLGAISFTDGGATLNSHVVHIVLGSTKPKVIYIHAFSVVAMMQNEQSIRVAKSIFPHQTMRGTTPHTRNTIVTIPILGDISSPLAAFPNIYAIVNSDHILTGRLFDELKKVTPANHFAFNSFAVGKSLFSRIVASHFSRTASSSMLLFGIPKNFARRSMIAEQSSDKVNDVLDFIPLQYAENTELQV